MKTSHSPLRAARFALLALWSAGAFGVQPSTRPPIPNLDVRTAAPPPAARDVGAEAATEELQRRVPGVRVERPRGAVGARIVGSTTGFLTGPGGEGGAVPAGQAQALAGGDPHRGVKAFLDEHRAFFGHGSAALTSARTRRDVTHDRLRTTVWQQEHAGIPIFEAVLQANRTAAGELVNIASAFVADPAKNAPPMGAQAIGPAQAVALAAGSLGETVSAANVVASAAAEGPAKRQSFRAPKLLDVSAEHVWLPMDARSMRLCWQVVLVSKARGEMFKVLVDAESGAVLVRHGLTNYISDASYRVFTSDSPTPFSPGHATPLTAQPSTVARTLVVTPAFNTTASPNGWIDDGVNETRGNNVDAHTDLNADNSPDTPRPQGSPNRVFDFPLDLTQAPSTYRPAAVTQLFYLCNRIHDRLYELGFTEAAGNFQNNNFGRGGAGNDAVQADAQDGSGTDNANFSTPPDGFPGRMQMFNFTGPTPDRDGDFDSEIVIHEYAHGLSNRLVGGGVGISALQSAGMGEGWSDFYGLCLLSEPGDAPAGNYAAGGYATYQLDVGYETNYYFGIRRFPYSTDLTKNPLTFKDIDSAQIGAYPGVPRSTVVGGGGAAEVHNQGEVWCSALWEVRANLIQKHGHAAGNELVLQLVTDGMKLAPANPNFLQARDAIIQADLVRTGGANRDELWAGFAKRGMGAYATSPDSDSTSGVVESFALPDDLSVAPVGSFTSRGPLGGPFDPSAQTFTLGNTNTMTAIGWTVTCDQPWVTLSTPSGMLAAGGSATVTATINSAANAFTSGIHTATISFTNTTSNVEQTREVRLLAGLPEYYAELFDTTPNDTAFQSWLFTPNGSADYYRVLRTTGVTAYPTDPAGGTNVTLSDDSSIQVNLSGGDQVSLYGMSYGSFFIGSNGYVTFGSGDTDWTESFAEHFSLPRIAALFDDLLPPNGGTISWRQLGDRVAVTWDDVPEFGTTNSNSLQIEMFFDGRIRITCLGLNATDGLIGLSAGGGEPEGFVETDFSELSALALTVNVPASATEGATPLTGTVTALSAPASDLVVTLTSDDPSEATVPATVTILAEQTSATFPITIADDLLLDGTHPVTISATAPEYTSTPATILVHDNETATLTLTAPASVAEGDGTFQAMLTLSAPVSGDVQILIASSSPTELAIETVITIPDGANSANLEVAVIDDDIINGTRTVTLSASVQGWTGASVPVSVQDNETTTLSISAPSLIYESTTANGTVAASGVVLTPLTVTLSSSAPSRLTVPLTVTIPAGASSAPFTLTATNNTTTDGTQGVMVTGTAPGFTPANRATSVRDDDVHHYTIGPIGSPQVRGAAFPVAITARDVAGGQIAIYTGSANLNAGGLIAIAPTSTGPFTGGLWTGNVTVNSFATGVVLNVNDGAGHTGSSAPFDVGLGALSQFTWAPIGGPHSIGALIPVTIVARDAGGNLFSGFTGTVSLSGIETAPVPIAPTVSGTFVNGTWSGTVAVLQAAALMRLRASDGAGHEGDSATFNVSGTTNLTVTPATGLTASGPYGGPFTPSSIAFTLTNSGTVATPWTATKSANWITVSPASGTLGVGGSAVVTATVLPSLLEPGTTNESVIFRNTVTGATTARPVAISVSLAGPVIVPEPSFTGGTSNALAWAAVPGAMRYEIERATAADFSDAVGSGPLTATAHTFAPLLDGTLYRYRVRGLRSAAAAALAWTQSTEAEFDTGTATDVATTPAGEVNLAIRNDAPIAGRIANPSFEGGSLTDWAVQTNSPGMAAVSTGGAGFAPMPTAGAFYAGLRSAHDTARTAGEFVRISRITDLTNATSLSFDALLASPAGSTWSGSLRAEFRIDGTTLWSSSAAGAQLNRVVDLSAYAGPHTIEFRAEVITTGTFNAQWFFLDNVRLLGPGFAPAGALVSPAITPASLLRWDALVFSSDVSAAGTALTVDVLSADGTTVLAANVASGTDLGELPATASQAALRLRANLSSTNSASTPALSDWTVNYRTAAATDLPGTWSTPVTSTQDATGPSVSVPLVTTNPIVSGTASDPAGIASITVNGNAATTSNGFANWTVNSPLTPGPNSISHSATDSAVPPNTSTGTTSVFLATMNSDADGDGLADAWEADNGLGVFDAIGANGALGDPDGDHIVNLLERAFALNPNASQPAGLPVLTREFHPGDLQPYIVLRYRRLLAPGALLYTVELSPDLQTWTPATAADIELIGTTPNGDGQTETVALRVKPSLLTQPTRHLRIEVRVP